MLLHLRGHLCKPLHMFSIPLSCESSPSSWRVHLLQDNKMGASRGRFVSTRSYNLQGESYKARGMRLWIRIIAVYITCGICYTLEPWDDVWRILRLEKWWVNSTKMLWLWSRRCLFIYSSISGFNYDLESYSETCQHIAQFSLSIKFVYNKIKLSFSESCVLKTLENFFLNIHNESKIKDYSKLRRQKGGRSSHA